MSDEVKNSEESPKNVPVGDKFVEEKELFVWNTLERPFKKRDKEFWVTLASICALVGFILFLIEGIISVMLVIALFFFYYVLSTVEPQKIQYSITNRNIIVAGRKNNLDLFNRFWFGNRMGSEILILEMNTFPGRLEMVIKEGDKSKIRNVLATLLPEEAAEPTRVEKASDWFAQKLPGNS